MTIIQAPPRAELVRRATDLVPLIRKHSAWQEENRVIHDEVLQALTDAGLLKMRVPVRYGGYESDLRTVVDVVAEVARADGSTGWTLSLWTVSAWLAGLFPDEVQDEVYANPDARVASTVGPTGFATPTDGGVILNGRWRFNTGIQQSQWDAHSALLGTDETGYVPALVLVPASALKIVDDWHTVGLRGTGSVTTVAENVFVPEARVLPMLPLVTAQQHRSMLNADSPVWRAPFSPSAAAVASSVPLGMARAAREALFERLPNRKITYTNYERQIEAPVTHLQVAEATMKIDEAEFHVHRAAARVETKVANGETWTMEERAIARLDMGAACQQAQEAVRLLKTASGASSVYSDQPMQRIQRDIETISLHAVVHPNNNLEVYGRVLCGLEPNTFLI